MVCVCVRLMQSKFVVKNSLGDIVPLVPDGAAIAVTDANVMEYYNLALSYRLNEFNRHVRMCM